MPELEEVERIEIVVLDDNFLDPLLPSWEEGRPEVLRPPLVREGGIPKSFLLADGGFSLLVRIFGGGEAHSFLFDAGWSEDVVLRNAAWLGVDLREIEAVILSHGHMDHFGGLKELARALGGFKLFAHPDAFRKRWIDLPEGRAMLPQLRREELEESGVRIEEVEGPRLLAGGKLLVLGPVERTTDFEGGLPGAYIEREGRLEPDLILDDQGIAVNLKGRGLFVITGCAHSGVVNTILHARKVTGVKEIYGVMGGFHLTGRGWKEAARRTIEELSKLNPQVVIPAHCTSWGAVKLFSESFGRSFILSSAGTAFRLP